MTSIGRNFQEGKFKCFVRYLVKVAKDKRCVNYYELENVFGLAHKQAGIYAGRLGDFCQYHQWPPLNGLIINTDECVPSDGFDWYQQQYGRSWGEIVSECWKRFHVPSSRPDQVQDFAQLDADIEEFLSQHLT